MKLTLLLTLIGFCFSMSSCTSEYEECLQQGKSLKARLTSLESNDLMYSKDAASVEQMEIVNEINLLAKLSGNEQLFLKEIFSN